MSAYRYTDFYKFGDAFSITSKFADWIGNPDWKEGYDLIGHPSGYSNEYTPFWEFVSAVAEREGSQIYSKIKHLVQNIRDIDTCEIYYLKALAKELGYSGDISFLDYNYPLEINRLLDIFSLNKDLLIKTNKVLYINSRTSLYTNTSAVLPSGIFDYFIPSALSQESQDRLFAVSGAPSGLYYTSDSEYQALVDAVFTDCLSTFINMKYREDEGDPTKSTIWEQIASQLVNDNLYNDERSFNDTIEKRKVDLRIPSFFNERKIVDNIQFGKDKIENYTIPEQEILGLEFNRREQERTKYTLISRFSPEREFKVKTYFRFVDLFNDDNSTTYGEYDVNTRFFEISGGTNVLLTTDGISYTLNESLITSTAKKLRNISLKISYLREELKRLVRKYNINGSELIIRILVKDLIRKYVYNSNSTWRFSSGANDLITSALISENENFEVEVVEYWDRTEYMNVSTQETPSGAQESLANTNKPLVNNRYWENKELDVNYITSADISDFYRNIIGLELGVPESEYTAELNNFLNAIYNSCATKETVNTLYDELTALVSSGTPFLSGDPLMDDAWLTESEWTIYSNGYVTSANTSGVFLSATNGGFSQEYVVIDNVDMVNVSGDTGSVPFTPASLIISGGAGGGAYTVGDLYIIRMYTRRDSITPTQRLVLSGPGLEMSATYITSAYSEVSASILATFASQSGYATPQYLDYPETTGVFEFTEAVFMATTSAASAYSLVFEDVLPISGGAWIASATFNKVLDLGTADEIETTYSDNGSAAFWRYSGIEQNGLAPYANWKNSLHSSFAAHPYLPNIYEKEVEIDGVNGLINYEAETSASEYLSGTIIDRIGPDGNTINSWKNTNIENVGYQTVYESSDNLNTAGVEDIIIDIDGPFNYNALSAYLSDPATFATSVTSETNEFYDSIGIINTEYIYKQLIRYENKIRELSGKSIYKYTVDQFGNHYTLYKDENLFNTSGELWVRFNNHPISFPAFELVGGNNSAFAAVNVSEHTNAAAYGDIVYDIGFSNNILWLATYSDIDTKVLICNIDQDYDAALERNVLKFVRSADNNLEVIEVEAGYKYCGTTNITNILNVVSVQSSIVSGLPIVENEYNINLRYELYDPEYFGRYSRVSDPQVVKYNEYDPTINTFRIEHNDQIFTLAFESERPETQVVNFVGYEETSGGQTTLGILEEASNFSIYSNSITLMDFSLEDQPYGKSIYLSDSNQKAIHYFFASTDVGHFGLFDVGTNGEGINHYAKYANTRVPVNTFTFSGVDNGNYDTFKFDYEAENPVSALEMQFFDKNYNYMHGRFELVSGFFIDVYSERDLSGFKNWESPSIYLSSDEFVWEFNQHNVINNQERKLYSSLFVLDYVTSGDQISPEDLLWTEDGDSITWETDLNFDSAIKTYNNYTFKITDFKEGKIRIESSRPTWTND